MPPLQKCHRSNLGKPPISEIKRRTNLKSPITNQSKTLDWENKFWEKNPEIKTIISYIESKIKFKRDKEKRKRNKQKRNPSLRNQI